MLGFNSALALVASIGLALTAPAAFAQGNGNGNGNGGGGGGGGETTGIYAPALLLSGHRFDLPRSPSDVILGDYLTTRMTQSEQIRPSDGSGRQPLHAVSQRGDLSVRQANNKRYVLDVRLSDTNPTALICIEELIGTHANPTWWYDPADEGVDTVLVSDLTGWDIFRAKWSQDLECIAVDGTYLGVQGIYLFDVVVNPSSGAPDSVLAAPTLLVPDAVDPTWGAGARLSYVTLNAAGPGGAARGSLFVADLDSGNPAILVTDQLSAPIQSEITEVGLLRGTTNLSPDGTHVAYTLRPNPASLRADIFVRPSNGSGAQVQVTNAQRVKIGGYYTLDQLTSPVWAPNGLELAFTARGTSNQGYVRAQTWRITVAGNSKGTRLTDSYSAPGEGGGTQITGGARPVAWRN